MIYLRVAFDIPLVDWFDYVSAYPIKPGMRVLVSFGKQRRVGIVVTVADKPQRDDIEIKPIIAYYDDASVVPEALLALLRFVADYYHYPLGQTLFSALPKCFAQPKMIQPTAELYYRVSDPAKLRQQLLKRALLQQRLAVLLTKPLSKAAIQAISPSAWKIVRQWINEGFIDILAVEAIHQPIAVSAVGMLPLNAEQQRVLAILLRNEGFQVYLLQGITGSGKTELYLHVMAKSLAARKQILILVPEINLTPQLLMRFQERFPTVPCVVLNSALNEARRTEHWLQAANGRASIVVGTRLAVFAALPQLGLIIVDEEHDASFKQQEGLRYHARDVAIYRAKSLNIPIILGSATPCLESWHNAQLGRYRLLRLQQRAVSGASLPALRLLSHRSKAGESGLHPELLTAIAQRLNYGQQSLVFINRRGFAPVMNCGECGWIAGCQRCCAKLVIHLYCRQLRCHYCGWHTPLVVACPCCGNQDLQALGQGTQRLECVLAGHFPQARIIRIDRDSMRRKGCFERVLQQIHDGQADILIGTQMLAKGHDFPLLTLVAVLNADAGLFAVDFRATERLYSLLVQVAGRSGRAHYPGEVYIQTAFPDHPLYQSLLTQRYESFLEYELKQRQCAAFPPFRCQALLRAQAERLDTALDFLHQACKLAPQQEAVTLYDPVAAVMVRIANRERAQLLLQSESRQALQRFLRQWMFDLRALPRTKVQWSIDVDPIEL